MSLADLDPVIHAPKRLAAMGILAASEGSSFQFLKDRLGLADSDLSKQMSALEAAGYVRSTKRGRGPGSTTTFVMTGQGRKAYKTHRAALYALLAEEAASSPEPAVEQRDELT